MRFREADGGTPVLSLVESGETMLLGVGFVGFVEYDRGQSEALAAHLEAAARMVRDHA